MGNERQHYEFTSFRQQFRNRPQRRRLGIHLEQDEAQAILADEAALRRAYEAWRGREGLSPSAATAPAQDAVEARSRASWLTRLLRRR